MKKSFVFLFLVFATITQAQTIHWLTFIDTTDPNVGKLDVNGREVLYNHYINVVNAVLKDYGYNSVNHDIYGSNLSPERCKQEVQNLRCGSNDIIMFYYIGHGTHAKEEKNPYPQMLLGRSWDEEYKFIPLKWVHDELKSKGARLTVTIGMCCNGIQSARAKQGPMFSVNYGNSYITDTERKAIEKMFLGYKGDLILSSAKVGQSSLGWSTPYGDMDLFSAVLIDTFESGASEGYLEWNQFFKDIQEMVNIITEGRQTPIFDPHITASSYPAKGTISTPTTKPAPTTVTKSSEDAILILLSAYLDYITDSSNNVFERDKMAQDLNNFFAGNAVVRIISQDGDHQVDKESARMFLERISTSRILMKVVPVSYRTNSDGIAELNVKEYYKK